MFLQRLRKLLTSVPSITVVGLMSAYLLVGFFLLPAVLKWQLEKQLSERGHVMHVGAVRFDPLRLTLEVNDLALADAQGAVMAGFDHLAVDLEWRSMTDRAWTIADARLLAPHVRIDRARDGSHNFSALLAQFAGTEPDSARDDSAGLPSLRVQSLQLANGRLEWFDQMLEQPLVSRIVPLQVQLHDLSTLADEQGRYRVSLRTEAGESLELHGNITIGSRQASGELALQGLQVATLARGLNRELVLQSPRGSLSMGGRFDLSIDANGVPAGGASDLKLTLADLFLQPPGDSNTPLLAAQNMALSAGRLDLAQRELHFDGLSIADASANAGIDAQGKGSWESVLRVAQAAPKAAAAASGSPPAPAPAPAPKSAASSALASASAPSSASVSPSATAATAPVPATPSAAEAPWSVSVGDVRVERLALALRDAAQQRRVRIAALGLGSALDAQIGSAAGNRVRLPQLRLTLDGLALEQGDAAVTVPSTRLDADVIALQAKGISFDATLDKLVLALAQGMSVRSAGQSASLGTSEVATAGVRARTSGTGARVEVEAPKLQSRSLVADQAGQSARIGQLGVGGARLVLDTGAGANGGNGIALALEGPKLQLDELAASTEGTGSTPAARQSTELGQLTLQARRLALDLAGGENSLSLDALQSQARKLQLLADGQTLSLASVALDNARLQVRQGGAGAQLQAETPALRLAGIAARRGTERAEMADLSLQGTRIDVRSGADGTTELAFTGMQAAGKQLALAREADTLQLASMALGSEVLKLVLGKEVARFSGNSAAVALTGVQARQSGNRLALQDARWKARAFDGRSMLAAGPAQANARIDDSELSLASFGLGRGQAGTGGGATSDTGSRNLATLASATWSAGSLILDVVDGPMQLRGNAMALKLDQALLHDPDGQGSELVQMGDMALSGAVFSLADRSVTAETLRVSGLRASAWLDAQGRLNLLEVVGASGPDAAVASVEPPTPAAATPAPAGPAGESPWRVAVRTVDLQDAAVRFEDRRRDPPLAMGLVAITLNLSGVDTAVGAPPMQLALGATLASGGEIQAKGSAALDPQAVDLQLAVTGLALAPVQPVVSEYAELTLASGIASTRGRLTYGAVADVPARLSYTGGFAVDRFLLEEITPKRPFLAWESVKSDDLKLTLEPNAVDIGEVMLDQPVGRLIIAEDQSINVTDVLKKRDGAATEDKSPTPASADDPPADAFPVTVARVKVSDGQLEFADLSLRPQFGTRMHQLKGVITGLSTDPERVAKVQLDARVDKFGSARIRGQASILQPEKLTEIDMAFRNLEMTSLSPYVVKFAGYEIASGRLSLDLQYKVRDGKLLGQNKVLLNQMALGKKVKSPDALDLPLELALAVLKDSNGVIDIGLPVSGDLNDPKFDYGAVIGKAIGNLLGGIVTAPFRALAAIFGGGGDKAIDTIDFEPGSAVLAPPEQQKVETVARALIARPQLQLKVAPVYAPRQDTPVLQSLTVRGEVARAMGLSLAPDEDPGPIDVANPRAAKAIEAAFSARYAPAVLDLLKQRAQPAAQAQALSGSTSATASEQPGSAGVVAPETTPIEATVAAADAVKPGASGAKSPATAPIAAPDLPPAFYQTLLDRMITEQVVSAQDLDALANRRADGIVQRLTVTDGVPSDRVALAEVREVADATDKVVPLKLQLDVAK